MALKQLLSRVLVVALALAVLYLVVVNTALNLPATRALLSRIQPATFAFAWERAYSTYPLRLVFTGVAADGSTPTAQWQLDAARVSASLSLLALFRGEVLLHHLALTDLDLRLRPLVRPDDDRSRLRGYFPVIRNRDPNALPGPAPAPKPGTLVLELDDIRVGGQHEVWVGQVRADLTGDIRADFRIDTATGELSLAEGVVDLALTDLVVGPEEPVTGDAMIRGRIDIPPFAPAATHGLALMRAGNLDVSLDLPVQSLAFVPWLMPPAAALDLSGQGRLRGRLVLEAGEALAGTDLSVEAHELAMGLGDYRFRGDGSVELRVDPADQSQADLIVRFDQVQAVLEASSGAGAAPAELFTGNGLTAQLHAAEVDPTTTSTAEEAAALLEEVNLDFTLSIPSMRVDDITVYNRLFPDQWDVRLLGGNGSLSGRFEVTADTLNLDLDLDSDNADLRLASYHAGADLLLKLRAAVARRGAEHQTATLDLTGTEVRLDDAKLTVADPDDGSTPAWSARLLVTEANLDIPLTKQAATGAVRAVAQTLSEDGFGAVLTAADGSASATLTVAQLDWIAALLGRPLGLGLDGRGELDLALVMADGWPAAGSTLRFPRDPLSATLLDYRIDGTGEASLTLGRSGRQPQAMLAITLNDARAHRRDEDQPSVDQIRMDAQLRVHDPFAKSIADAAEGAALRIKIHSAGVPDMRSYNPYLPGHAPVAFTGGAASLAGDLELTADSASGELLLSADGVGLKLADADVSGDLRLELLLRDGAAEDLRFDITGSSLKLTGFRVTGAAASTTDADWHARLQLEDTEVLWQKPMHLNLKADMTIKDTQPFIALVDDLRAQHGWLDDLLLMQDLGGHLKLRIDGEQVLIDDLMLTGPEIGVHVKGRSTAGEREAMLLLRWHELSGALELHGAGRHFDLVDARTRFDAYLPGRTPLPAVHAGAGTPNTRAAAMPSTAAPGYRPPASTSAAPHRPARPQPAKPNNPFLDDDL